MAWWVRQQAQLSALAVPLPSMWMVQPLPGQSFSVASVSPSWQPLRDWRMWPWR
jgi:hypothetical protein